MTQLGMAEQSVHVVASVHVPQPAMEVSQFVHAVPSDHWFAAQAVHAPPLGANPDVPPPLAQVVHVEPSLQALQPVSKSEHGSQVTPSDHSSLAHATHDPPDTPKPATPPPAVHAVHVEASEHAVHCGSVAAHSAHTRPSDTWLDVHCVHNVGEVRL